MGLGEIANVGGLVVSGSLCEQMSLPGQCSVDSKSRTVLTAHAG